MPPEEPPVNPPPLPKSQPRVAPSLRPRLPQNLKKTPSSRDMLEPDEELVTVVRRHPIGLFYYYIEVFFGLLVVIGFFAFFIYALKDSLGQQYNGIIVSSAIVAVTILVLFLFVATYVYRQCRLLVTDRSLVQILQTSLFIRKVSRLSLSNVEDVSAESKGIFPSIFGYGTLLIQTAGTLENFEFPYCPNPTYYADQIVEARQRYAVSLQEEEHHPAEHAIRNQ